MPQASDELRAKFPHGPEEALDEIKPLCVVGTGGVIQPRNNYSQNHMTKRQWEAVDYLVEEWDYGWTPVPAQPSSTESKP